MSIFDLFSRVIYESDIVCPQCGKGKLIFISVPVPRGSAYCPKCNYSKNLGDDGRGASAATLVYK